MRAMLIAHIWSILRDHAGDGLFFLVDVVDAHEGAGEGGYFAEGYEEGFVDLALGVDKDSAIEHYEATYTEDGGGEELDGKFVFHIDSFNSVL